MRNSGYDLGGRATTLDVAREIAARVVRRDAPRRAAAHAPDAGIHTPTEDMVNMRAALPQRVDSHGTKIEELAGTGAPDAPGG